MHTLPLLLFVAALQFGVERPLTPQPFGRDASSMQTVAAVGVGDERAVIWSEAAPSGQNTYVTWLDADYRNLGPATPIYVASPALPTSAASDGTNVALLFSNYAASRVDILHRDGSLDANTYASKGSIRQIVSNGHGYLVREPASITPLDAEGHLTGAPLAIDDDACVIVTIGARYLFIAHDLFGVGARWLDERSMTLGERMHVAARGPDARLAGAAGTRRGFAVLWSEQRSDYAGDFRVIQYDERGNATTPAVAVAANQRFTSLCIAASGDEYVVLRHDADLVSVDGAGRVHPITLPPHSGEQTEAVIGDGDPATIAWRDRQIYATAPVASRWRVASDVLVSFVRHDQISPRIIELDGRAYVAWVERSDPDLLRMARLNAERTAVEGEPILIPTTGPNVFNVLLTTDGARLLLSWSDGFRSTGGAETGGIALIDSQLHVDRQLVIPLLQRQLRGTFWTVWDGTSFDVIALHQSGAFVVQRFSSNFDDLGTRSSPPWPGFYVSRLSVVWTGGDFVMALVRGFGGVVEYTRVPGLEFDLRKLPIHTLPLSEWYDTLPAVAATANAVLVSGSSMAILSMPSRIVWLDNPPPSTQPHAIWNPAGWFLLTNGAYLLRVDEHAGNLGVASLGDGVTETAAIERGSVSTLLYVRNGRLYLRSMQ